MLDDCHGLYGKFYFAALPDCFRVGLTDLKDIRLEATVEDNNLFIRDAFSKFVCSFTAVHTNWFKEATYRRYSFYLRSNSINFLFLVAGKGKVVKTSLP